MNCNWAWRLRENNNNNMHSTFTTSILSTIHSSYMVLHFSKDWTLVCSSKLLHEGFGWRTNKQTNKELKGTQEFLKVNTTSAHDSRKYVPRDVRVSMRTLGGHGKVPYLSSCATSLAGPREHGIIVLFHRRQSLHEGILISPSWETPVSFFWTLSKPASNASLFHAEKTPPISTNVQAPRNLNTFFFFYFCDMRSSAAQQKSSAASLYWPLS